MFGEGSGHVGLVLGHIWGMLVVCFGHVEGIFAACVGHVLEYVWRMFWGRLSAPAPIIRRGADDRLQGGLAIRSPSQGHAWLRYAIINVHVLSSNAVCKLIVEDLNI